VLSVDVRGRGDSQWGPPDKYNIATYVSDLSQMLDRLDIAQASLIGTSMGGRIAILYAGMNPDRIDRVVLNDIGPALDPAALANLNRWVAGRPDTFNNLDEVKAFYRGIGFGPRDDGEFLEILKWLVRPGSEGRLVWKMDPAINRPPAGHSSVRSEGYWEEFQRIRGKVLVIRGALSDILTPEIVDRMVSMGRAVRVVEIPKVGHAPSLSEPEALETIKEFFGI
jgi:pimeloyl-ACP methyl ester carboxylesterase